MLGEDSCDCASGKGGLARSQSVVFAACGSNEFEESVEGFGEAISNALLIRGSAVQRVSGRTA